MRLDLYASQSILVLLHLTSIVKEKHIPRVIEYHICFTVEVMIYITQTLSLKLGSCAAPAMYLRQGREAVLVRKRRTRTMH